MYTVSSTCYAPRRAAGGSGLCRMYGGEGVCEKMGGPRTGGDSDDLQIIIAHSTTSENWSGQDSYAERRIKSETTTTLLQCINHIAISGEEGVCAWLASIRPYNIVYTNGYNNILEKTTPPPPHRCSPRWVHTTRRSDDDFAAERHLRLSSIYSITGLRRSAAGDYPYNIFFIIMRTHLING